jgi:hypothetical protein
MRRTKLGLVVAVAMAVLAVPVMVAASDAPAVETEERSHRTVFDIFELSPEQFVTLMSTNDD